jgi:hypothetical protein
VAALRRAPYRRDLLPNALDVPVPSAFGRHRTGCAVNPLIHMEGQAVKNTIYIIIALLLLALLTPSRACCKIHVADDGNSPWRAFGQPWDTETSVSKRYNDRNQQAPQHEDESRAKKDSTKQEPPGGGSTP